MKKINLFLILSFLVSVMMGQNKSFTLEDLLPGGNNFWNLQPKSMNLTWWGDNCIERTKEQCSVINKKDGKKSVLFTLEEVKQWLGEDQELATACTAISFPYAEKEQFVLRTAQKDFIVDFLSLIHI